MTTRRQILNLLHGNPFSYTDRELASVTDRPVPSIRRTRLQMEYDGLLTMAGNALPMEWTLTEKGRSLAAAR